MRRTFVVSFLVVSGCGGHGAGGAQQATSCPSGRTVLDGVCVSEQVADYVACVRAQGARLGEDRGQKLSAEAGFAGTRAAAASDVREKLERSYSTTDASALEIVKTCGALHGARGASATTTTAPFADLAGSYAGEDVYADGRRSAVAATIEQSGEAFRVSWGKFAGYGMAVGDTFAAGYVAAGDPCGIAVYDLDGANVSGSWAWSQGKTGRETWAGGATLSGEFALGPESEAKRVRVSPSGAVHHVEWIYDPPKAVRSVGVGLKVGNRFFVGYSVDEKVGVMVYHRRARALDGAFAWFDQTTTSRELLRR